MTFPHRRMRLAAPFVVALAAWTFARPDAGGAPLRPLLSDLSDAVHEALREESPDDPRELLERVFSVEPSYRFSAGLVAVETDRRWFATMPPAGPGSPLLEIRRWPGDTVLTFYALEGEGGEGPQEIPGAALARTRETDRQWSGTLDTPMGTRPVHWVEKPVPDVPKRLGALLVPGDAGLGLTAVEDLLEELAAVVRRAQVNPEGWRHVEGLAPADPIVVPDAGAPPADANEATDPWQVVEGNGFTLGLPPGLRVRRVDLGVDPPRGKVPDGLLWIRGRFRDRDGLEVVVGDGLRPGYIAVAGEIGPDWLSGKTGPLGAGPGATRVDGDQLDRLVTDWTGASAARVDHWTETGFAGDWLVFRLAFQSRGVEIGLPVLSNWRSMALFWVPFTWRGPGRPPAPPPVDPAERFGIEFQRLTRTDRQRNPFIEGYLVAPGFRTELPRDWFPVASLRTKDGFPVTLVGTKGSPVGQLRRLDAPPDGLEESGWTAAKRPKIYRATAAYDRRDGSRLYVAREGHAYVLEPIEGGPRPEPSLWKRVVDSVTLTRP